MRPSRSPMGSTPAQVTSPAAIRVSRPAEENSADARRQNGALRKRCGDGRALQIFDRIEKRIEIRAAARSEHALPVGEKASQRVLLHRLDFAAQARQRLAPDEPQHFGIAPFAMEAAGKKSTFEDAAFLGELAQGVLDFGCVQCKSFGGSAQREGAVGTRIAAHQLQNWMRDWLEQRSR